MKSSCLSNLICTTKSRFLSDKAYVQEQLRYLKTMIYYFTTLSVTVTLQRRKVSFIPEKLRKIKPKMILYSKQ